MNEEMREMTLEANKLMKEITNILESEERIRFHRSNDARRTGYVQDHS